MKGSSWDKSDDDQIDDDQNSERRLKYNIESFLIRIVETLKKSTANKRTKILLLNN